MSRSVPVVGAVGSSSTEMKVVGQSDGGGQVILLSEFLLLPSWTSSFLHDGHPTYGKMNLNLTKERKKDNENIKMMNDII